jgi:hypothetical protein
MRYKKAPVISETALLGMLYIVEVRLVRKDTSEKIKHKLLLIGCEHSDIERKIRWMFNSNEYKEMSISGIEKVREKVHFLSTIVTQLNAPVGPVIERDEGSQVVPQQKTEIDPYAPKLFAVGITTTMLAQDENHALRKIGNALISIATEGRSHSGAALSHDSTVAIEEISRGSGYAMPRDVSKESNVAHLIRG